MGTLEGLGLYLNGTDLPQETYATSDVNFVFEEINRLLGEAGRIQSYWEGASETALYMYGQDAEAMRGLIAGFVAEYPLCQKARIEKIA